MRVLRLESKHYVGCKHMCHHTLDTEPEKWRYEQTEDDEEDDPADSAEPPEFANDDAAVDVELLDADD